MAPPAADQNMAFQSCVESTQNPVLEDLNAEGRVATAARTHAMCLLISDSMEVAEFLKSRLQGLQQNALKRLAKAWIAGICLKKPTHFPYWEGDEVLGWWPSTITYPSEGLDHIGGDQLIQLCVYILRLRLSPESLKLGNSDLVKPYATHVFEGWTAFLMEVAPAAVMSESHSSNRVTEKERRLLNETYILAQMEEDFKQGGVDPDALFEWCDEEDQPGGDAQSYVERTDRANKHPDELLPFWRATSQEAVGCLPLRLADV